ncbi:hypothetical protein [Sorangium cellulosum]|uniref:Uncharacterized protein n=1 Tax=Sorangium cellulosum TaxID=56 RepID=A0A150Q5P0_SORCE|nr:hypothetical protein [Sorangium cellulosum]KYF63299.1 hypothetical protein BE15_22525 [Sorangium cellulosum]
MAPLEDPRPEQLAAIEGVAEGAAIELAEEGAAIGVAEESAAIEALAEEGAAIELADGAAGGERVAGAAGAAGAAGRRVRFARGVSEMPGERAVVVLHEDTILRWRPTPDPPAGALARLSEVAVGAAIAVEHGGTWDEGLVLGRVVRPARAGGFRVDGDVERYPSIAEAERAHGPLEAGDPQEPPARNGDPVFELGEPMGRDARGLARRARR